MYTFDNFKNRPVMQYILYTVYVSANLECLGEFKVTVITKDCEQGLNQGVGGNT